MKVVKSGFESGFKIHLRDLIKDSAEESWMAIPLAMATDIADA
jgi:hypothetical protein